MLAEERQAILHGKLREDGYVQVSEIANEFGISSATIRRDLVKLEKEGLCIRKRGGAVRTAHGVTMEIPYEIKRRQHSEEKIRIAQAALKFVENGDTIILDAGSTIYALALLLHNRERLTVVTHDLNIAFKLATNPNIKLICTGGIARENVFTLEGSQVTDFILNLRVDKTFLGADAIHPDGVVSNVNIEEVPIKKAMIQAAEEFFLLSDSSKFNVTGFAKVCDLSEIDHLITDSGISQTSRKLVHSFKVDTILA